MAELLDTQLFAAYLMNEVHSRKIDCSTLPGSLSSFAISSLVLCRCQHGFLTRILVVLNPHVLKGEADITLEC
jgi:hypothetical protein